MERKLAKQIAKLVGGSNTPGYTVTPITRERMRWRYGERKSVGLFDIHASSEQQLWLLCVAWRATDAFYIVATDTAGYPILEIRDVVEERSRRWLSWSYRPAKRDSKNHERLKYFKQHFGETDVRIPVPDRAVDLFSFLDEIFLLAANRQWADRLEEQPVGEQGFHEGRLFERRHLARERSSTLVRLAKERAVAAGARLDCCICGFDFRAFYGSVGEGYIEAHHTVPVRELTDDCRRPRSLRLASHYLCEGAGTQRSSGEGARAERRERRARRRPGRSPGSRREAAGFARP